jgi:hypothetical protein
MKEIFTIINDPNIDTNKIKNEKEKTNEEEELESITDEEYLLDCSRFGDLDELKNLLEENKTIDINYKDQNKNNSLRK